MGSRNRLESLKKKPRGGNTGEALTDSEGATYVLAYRCEPMSEEYHPDLRWFLNHGLFS